MSDALRPADSLLARLRKTELEEIAAGHDEHAETARAELERRRLNRARKREARETAAQTPEQLDIETDLDEREGLDVWIDSLPCPPWVEDEGEGEVA